MRNDFFLSHHLFGFLGLLFLSGNLAGCSYYTLETRTEQNLLASRTEKEAVPLEKITHTAEVSGDSLILTSVRLQECREREIKKVEHVHTTTAPTWAIATDLVVGGLMTLGGVSRLAGASGKSGDPVINDDGSEGNSPRGDAYFGGAVFTLGGVGLTALGSWVGLGFANEQRIRPESTGQWWEVSCDGLPCKERAGEYVPRRT
jgi:hypothetical protein